MAADPLASLAASRVVVVAGKGGVGKTTVTAVLARAAARSGLRVLVIELDGKPALADLVGGGRVSGDGDRGDGGTIDVIAISAPDALDEYLREHGFRRIAKRLASTGVIDVVGTAAPGIDDIVVLGKVKQLERSGDWDLIVVDGPAAGHAITFLTSASGMLDAVRGGPVRAQATDVLELLGDPARCQVVLVTLPEAMPINEVVETAFALEDQVGVQLGPVVVNGVDLGETVPDPDDPDVMAMVAAATSSSVAHTEAEALLAAARFRRARGEMQRRELLRLSEALPLAQVHVAALPVAGLGPSDVEELAAPLVDGRTSVPTVDRSAT